MKREERNILSKQRILDAAMEEFSKKGYEGASLNTACAEKGISKGILYHYFQGKDDLYLLCVETCFNAVTAYLKTVAEAPGGTPEARLRNYFDARLRFFAGHPLYFGIFADASFRPPTKLLPEIEARRREFDALNISVLTALLNSGPLRSGLSVQAIVEDFRTYMDFFNMRFQAALPQSCSTETVLQEHEERCHRQLDILLHGVLEETYANS